MQIEVSGHTHVGMKRNHNEDNLLLLPEERLFVVADGMGGHSSGEVASKIAVSEIAEFFRRTSSSDEDVTWPYKLDTSKGYDENRLIVGMKLANGSIFRQANNDLQLKGMGTTIAGVYFANDNLVLVGHVGDSRVYCFRDGKLKQLTEDHSLLNEYLKTKTLTPEEIEVFPHKNVIVRALGMHDTVLVDINRIQPKRGDVYLLCSDGLSGMVYDEEIEHILLNHSHLERAVMTLIDAANMNGGTDNITCVLARFT